MKIQNNYLNIVKIKNNYLINIIVIINITIIYINMPRVLPLGLIMSGEKKSNSINIKNTGIVSQNRSVRRAIMRKVLKCNASKKCNNSNN